MLKAFCKRMPVTGYIPWMIQRIIGKYCDSVIMYFILLACVSFLVVIAVACSPLTIIADVFKKESALTQIQEIEDGKEYLEFIRED